MPASTGEGRGAAPRARGSNLTPDVLWAAARGCRRCGAAWSARARRQSYYECKKRFALEGWDRLRERTAAEPDPARAALRDRGRDRECPNGEFNGPFSVADRLVAEGVSPEPSWATIARIPSRPGEWVRSHARGPRRSNRQFTPVDRTRWLGLDRPALSGLSPDSTTHVRVVLESNTCSTQSVRQQLRTRWRACRPASERCDQPAMMRPGWPGFGRWRSSRRRPPHCRRWR